MPRYKMILVGASVLSLGLGATAGFFFAQKKLETKYEAIAQKEIAEAKKFYSLRYKKDEYATPESAVESRLKTDADVALQNYKGNATRTERNEAVSAIDATNIFLNNIPDTPVAKLLAGKNFNYEEEIKHRSADAPYIITKDEFFNEESGFDQVTVTYFDEDGVLIDDKDEVIPDVNLTIGEDNLAQFGHGSEDPNIVYIHNDKLTLEFEVILSKGKYTEQILGYIKHSEDPDPHKIRKFQFKDDDE